jgi:hypothetical protein
MKDNTTLHEPATSMVKCAFYGRTVSPSAGPEAIASQLHVCREFAELKGWTLLEDHLYIDEGKSGTLCMTAQALRS